MRRWMGTRRAPYPSPNATVASRIGDAAFVFAAEHGAGLEERVRICFFYLAKVFFWQNDFLAKNKYFIGKALFYLESAHRARPLVP